MVQHAQAPDDSTQPETHLDEGADDTPTDEHPALDDGDAQTDEFPVVPG